MTMIEKMARALAIYVPEQIADEAARAALTAMLEPTDTMIEDGADEYHEACRRAKDARRQRNDIHERHGRGRIAAEDVTFPYDWIRPTWSAMIQAALDEPTNLPS